MVYYEVNIIVVFGNQLINGEQENQYSFRNRGSRNSFRKKRWGL